MLINKNASGQEFPLNFVTQNGHFEIAFDFKARQR